MAEQPTIPISISVRHVHLSKEHLEQLFGKGYTLTPHSELSQPGQFACEEVVEVVGPKGSLKSVRILSPLRSMTQVEISRTDEFQLGIDAPIRASGNLENTPGVTLIGPAGTLELPQGVIQAERHIHMHPDDARRFGVHDKDYVMIKVGGERGIIFDDVLVRVNESYRLDMHVDTDEANAADLHPGSVGILIKDPTMAKPDPTD
jgi:propanediol utilization protein